MTCSLFKHLDLIGRVKLLSTNEKRKVKKEAKKERKNEGREERKEGMYRKEREREREEEKRERERERERIKGRCIIIRNPYTPHSVHPLKIHSDTEPIPPFSFSS